MLGTLLPPLRKTILHSSHAGNAKAQIYSLKNNASQNSTLEDHFYLSKQKLHFAGVHPTFKDDNGDTIVHKALRAVTSEIIRNDVFRSAYDQAELVLSTLGIDPTIQNNAGDTILHEAVRTKKIELIKKVLALINNLPNDKKKLAIDAKNNAGQTALHVFANLSGQKPVKPSSQFWKFITSSHRYDLQEENDRKDYKEIQKIARTLIFTGGITRKAKAKTEYNVGLTALQLAEDRENGPVRDVLESPITIIRANAQKKTRQMVDALRPTYFNRSALPRR